MAQDVSRILADLAQGNTNAAEALLPLVYAELRKLASQKLAQEAPGQTLQATALVHEAYVRLVGANPGQRWDGRGHFFASYRLRKLVKRHRGPVLAAAAVVAGTVGTTVGMVRAERARREAALAEASEREQRQEAERARQEALRRLVQIEKGTDVLGSIFQDLDPKAEEKEGKPLRLILAERLNPAAEQLDGEGVGDPVTVAKLQNILGESLRNTEESAQAIRVLEKAAATRAAQVGTTTRTPSPRATTWPRPTGATSNSTAPCPCLKTCSDAGEPSSATTILTPL